jgi:hypothetical protein
VPIVLGYYFFPYIFSSELYQLSKLLKFIKNQMHNDKSIGQQTK